MRDGDTWDIEGKTYVRFDEPGQVYFWTESEENCDLCATHRDLHAKMAERDVIKTWPMGEPLCTWHMNMRAAALDAMDFARELAAMPRLVDQLQVDPVGTPWHDGPAVPVRQVATPSKRRR